LVAPGRVVDLPDLHLRDIARDQPVDEPGRVTSRHHVLEERRHVDERGRVADRVVLVLVMALVRAHRVVAGPLAVVQAFAESERALVYGSSDRHTAAILFRRSEAVSTRSRPPDMNDMNAVTSRRRHRDA